MHFIFFVPVCQIKLHYKLKKKCNGKAMNFNYRSRTAAHSMGHCSLCATSLRSNPAHMLLGATVWILFWICKNESHFYNQTCLVTYHQFSTFSPSFTMRNTHQYTKCSPIDSNAMHLGMLTWWGGLPAEIKPEHQTGRRPCQVRTGEEHWPSFYPPSYDCLQQNNTNVTKLRLVSSAWKWVHWTRVVSTVTSSIQWWPPRMKIVAKEKWDPTN